MTEVFFNTLYSCCITCYKPLSIFVTLRCKIETDETPSIYNKNTEVLVLKATREQDRLNKYYLDVHVEHVGIEEQCIRTRRYDIYRPSSFYL